VVATFDTDAWGNVLPSTVDNVPGGASYTFVGGLGVRRDNSTGLYYMRQRWYDPQLGRFVSRDPIESINLYVYVNNRSQQAVDPSGLWSYNDVRQLLTKIKSCGNLGEWWCKNQSKVDIYHITRQNEKLKALYKEESIGKNFPFDRLAVTTYKKKWNRPTVGHTFVTFGGNISLAEATAIIAHEIWHIRYRFAPRSPSLDTVWEERKALICQFEVIAALHNPPLRITDPGLIKFFDPTTGNVKPGMEQPLFKYIQKHWDPMPDYIAPQEPIPDWYK